MPTLVDQRRLRDGAKAQLLDEPKTAKEIRAQLDVLHDGIAALQSLDDLGSEEANDQAWNDMLALQRKAEVLRERLRQLETQ